jgi:NAD+ diphosphatase
MAMGFVPEFLPPTDATVSKRWFVFRGDKILVKRVDEEKVIPYFTDLTARNLDLNREQYIGSLDGVACYSIEIAEGEIVPEGTVLSGLRELLGAIDEEVFTVAGRASQMAQWNRTHQFCGRCGYPTHDKTDERAKICSACGLINYPRVSPAIIVAIVKDDHILLARSARFKTGLYSVLAGFVEPGEKLEDCVQREVAEEVAIRVKNIRYFGSQPWPFPNSLMVGFTAEYSSGEISMDPSEIIEADWFTAYNLPQIPGKFTIARSLIDWFVRSPIKG